MCVCVFFFFAARSRAGTDNSRAPSAAWWAGSAVDGGRRLHRTTTATVVWTPRLTATGWSPRALPATARTISIASPFRPTTRSSRQGPRTAASPWHATTGTAAWIPPSVRTAQSPPTSAKASVTGRWPSLSSLPTGKSWPREGSSRVAATLPWPASRHQTPLAVTATIAPVVPNPSSASVSSVTITFSEPVSGFDLTDLQLTTAAGANLLTADQTLTTSDNQTWTLGNLDGLTDPAGPRRRLHPHPDRGGRGYHGVGGRRPDRRRLLFLCRG